MYEVDNGLAYEYAQIIAATYLFNHENDSSSSSKIIKELSRDEYSWKLAQSQYILVNPIKLRAQFTSYLYQNKLRALMLIQSYWNHQKHNKSGSSKNSRRKKKPKRDRQKYLKENSSFKSGSCNSDDEKISVTFTKEKLEEKKNIDVDEYESKLDLNKSYEAQSLQINDITPYDQENNQWKKKDTFQELYIEDSHRHNMSNTWADDEDIINEL